MRGNSFEPDFRDVTGIIAACFPDGEPARITAPVRPSGKEEPRRASRRRSRRPADPQGPATEQNDIGDPHLQ